MKSGRKIKYLIIFLSIILFFTIGCKKSGPVEPPDPPQPLPDDLALFASIDGNWCGIQVFNANTLGKLDSLETTPGVPFCIEFSPDYSLWHTIVKDTLVNSNLITINAKSKEVINHVLTPNSFVISAVQGQFLVTHYRGGVIQVRDPHTFSLINSISTSSDIPFIVDCPYTSNIFGLNRGTVDDPGVRVDVSNLKDFRLESIIRFSDGIKRLNMDPAAIKISPDGNYIFITVFNWVGGGGYGTFHVVDLNSQKVIGEYLCGKFSQMCVSPDGKYVYISDPAGYKYEMIPTGHLLRYDITTKTMELFIDWVPYNLTRGAWGGKLPTDRIVIAPDNRTMFITPLGGQTSDGETIGIIKIDINTKKILGYYIMPKDYRGYVTQRIVQLKLGRYRQ